MPPRASRGSRIAGIATLVALGLLAARGASHSLAGWLARGAGTGLAEVAGGFRLPGEAGDEAGPSVEALQALSGAAAVDLPRGYVERRPLPSASSPQRARGEGAPGGPMRPEAPLGILVRESVVRAAVARGGRPSGTPIGPQGERPAGLVLSGVSSYGSALRDGDILTRVGGTPATSASRVIGAVSGALRSGARAIDGEVWRGLRRVPIVVELPKLGARKARKKRRSARPPEGVGGDR